MSESDAPWLSAGAEAAAQEAQRWLDAGRGAELVEVLLGELSDSSPWRRERALQWLRRLPAAPLLDPLLAGLANQRHADRRNAARCAWAALAAPDAQAPEVALARLAEVLASHPDLDTRVMAAAALGESANPAARPALEHALSAGDPNLVAAAVDALGLLGDARAADALLPLAAEGDFWTRAAALSALGRLRDPRALPVLERAMSEPWLAAVAAEAVGAMGEPAGLGALRAALQGDPTAHDAALRAAASILGRHPDLALPDWLRQAATAVEARLAQQLSGADAASAARLLGVAGSVPAARALVAALSDPALAEIAAAGMGLLPPQLAEATILERLPQAATAERVLLLTALPPLSRPEAAEQVARHLADPDAEVRSAAADALASSEPAWVRQLLRERQAEPPARAGVALTLGRMQPPDCDGLLDLLQDADVGVRAAAAEGLGRCGERAVEPLIDALRTEQDPATCQALVAALGAVGGEEAARALTPWLGSEEPGLRFAVIRSLGCTGAAAALPALLHALADPLPEMQAAALRALGELGDRRAEGSLAEGLRHPDPDVRRTAATALERLAPAAAATRLREALHDPDREMRLLAVYILRRLGGAHLLPVLERVADADPDPHVRQEAALAVVGLRAAAESDHE